MSKRAVILAGGKGTRLRPYTAVLPKPLMPIGDYPILEVIIRQLAHFAMGPLSLINDLPDHFLVMNGDILTDLDFGLFYNNHVNADTIFTISSYVREHINLYGVLDVNDDGELTAFREKPVSKFEVSMGIYMLSKRVCEHIPHDTPYGFDALMLKLLETSDKPSVKAFNGYWLDIGRADDYMQAIEEFEEKKSLFLR